MAPRLPSVTPANRAAWVVGDMHRDERGRIGGHSNCLVDVLVSLSQKNRLRKASSCLVISAAGLGLTFVYRTDSVIMTLMSYSVNTGLLTRWEFILDDSTVSTNQSSILATSMLVIVSYLFLHLVSETFLTAWSVPSSAPYFSVGCAFLVDE